MKEHQVQLSDIQDVSCAHRECWVTSKHRKDQKIFIYNVCACAISNVSQNLFNYCALLLAQNISMCLNNLNFLLKLSGSARVIR